MRWPGARVRRRSGRPPDDRDVAVTLAAAGLVLLLVCGLCCAVAKHALQAWLAMW